MIRNALTDADRSRAAARGWDLAFALIDALHRRPAAVANLLTATAGRMPETWRAHWEAGADAASESPDTAAAFAKFRARHGVFFDRKAKAWTSHLPDSHFESAWRLAVKILESFAAQEGAFKTATPAEATEARRAFRAAMASCTTNPRARVS